MEGERPGNISDNLDKVKCIDVYADGPASDNRGIGLYTCEGCPLDAAAHRREY